MAKARNKRGKPPSREKYEKGHPTVSARLPVEIRDKLRLVLRKLDTSLTEALTAFANEQEIKLKPLDEVRKTCYQEAKSRYLVTFPCAVCGKTIEITDPETKKVVTTYMAEHGWGHAECHKKKPAP